MLQQTSSHALAVLHDRGTDRRLLLESLLSILFRHGFTVTVDAESVPPPGNYDLICLLRSPASLHNDSAPDPCDVGRHSTCVKAVAELT